MDTLKYFLKHKDVIIALLQFTEREKITDVQVITKAYMGYVPIGYKMTVQSLNRWWHNRKANKKQPLLSDLGLSMTDCYWVCPMDSCLAWENVSLYRNNFVDNTVALDIVSDRVIRKADLPYTPHNTTKGEMPKKWFCLDDKQRVLVKIAYSTNTLQCINECFATELHKWQQKFAYTDYSLCNVQTKQGVSIGCACNSFCSEHLELYTYWDLIHHNRQVDGRSDFEFAVDVLAVMFSNREYVERWFSYLFLTDFILSNTDRHMENIGFLRNADTLQTVDFAPIFDTGNSMFWNYDGVPQGKDLLDLRINYLCAVETNMFQFVKYIDAVDLDLLPTDIDIRNFYGSALTQYRLQQLIDAYNYKIDVIWQIQKTGSVKQVLSALKSV